MTDATPLLQKLAGWTGHQACATQSTQTQLIRKIQQHYGDEPCFATDKRNDCAEVCEWQRNCRPYKNDIAQWLV